MYGNAVQPDYNYDDLIVEKLFAYLIKELPEAEIIVFGHFHLPVIKPWDDRLSINPGSIAPRKGQQSYAMLELGAAEPEIEIIEL